jgi:hypothetical protein
MPDWRNHSIMARWCLYYSLKYKLLADTKRPRFLCVRSVGAVVHVFVLPVREHYWSWHSVQSAKSRDALLFIIQSVILNYVDYWWLPTVGLTEIVSIFRAIFPVQLEVI